MTLDTTSPLADEAANLAHQREIIAEAWADLELAAEDRGWIRMGAQLDRDLTRQGLIDITRNCRIMSVASPLVKRGVLLRTGYVWGQGVQVNARDEDVNAVVQAFWDDPSNQAAFTSSQAQEENERVLATDGNFTLAFFTNRVTGRVQVRSTPFDEITDVICNPEDRDDPWLYERHYTTTVVKAFQPASGPLTTRSRPATVRVLHPAVGYWPAVRPKSIDGIPVNWDAPMLHVPVNRLDGAKWGIPDVYASLPWARAYEDFLTDWARLMKSLSRFAWRASTDTASKARKVAQSLAASYPTAGGYEPPAGQVAAMGPGANLEAIPKTGATIDADSGKPLAALVAAGLGLPLTTLLADPGTTGARAVAETLDKPTVLEMGMRRKLWTSVIQTVLAYVVDQAVRAPGGMLRGTTLRDRYTGRETVTLAGDAERTVIVDWPDLNDLDPKALVDAVVAAAGTGALPPKTTATLLLQALKVDDIDELLEPFFDDEGRWLPTAGDAAARRFDQGQDPAAVEGYRR